MTERDRLKEAVQRVATGIEHGAKLRGLELPPGFAMERARNIVSGLVELFDDAYDAGFTKGYKDGVDRGFDHEQGSQQC